MWNFRSNDLFAWLDRVTSILENRSRQRLSSRVITLSSSFFFTTSFFQIFNRMLTILTFVGSSLHLIIMMIKNRRKPSFHEISKHWLTVRFHDWMVIKSNGPKIDQISLVTRNIQQTIKLIQYLLMLYVSLLTFSLQYILLLLFNLYNYYAQININLFRPFYSP